mgnify:CR=1 FL=1
MNPITRLSIFFFFSISILLSKNESLLLVHFCIFLAVFCLKRALWFELWKSIKSYWIYLPLSGLIFILISFILSTRTISDITVDVILATVRLSMIISLMTLYVLDSKSQNIVIALRSIWYSTRSNSFFVDKMILFLEMTLRFFPLVQKDWNETQRTQKALSFVKNRTVRAQILNIAIFIPDFIIINLERTDNIIDNMTMRGYGSNPKRSIYPFVDLKVHDFIVLFLVLFSTLGLHYYY